MLKAIAYISTAVLVTTIVLTTANPQSYSPNRLVHLRVVLLLRPEQVNQ